MHQLLPPSLLKLPPGLLNPEIASILTPFHTAPVALVVRRARAHGQAVRAQPEAGRAVGGEAVVGEGGCGGERGGGRGGCQGQLGEEHGDVEDAEWEVACVFGGGEREGKWERGELGGEALAGEEQANLGRGVREGEEEEVDDVVGEGEEWGGRVVGLVVGCRVGEELDETVSSGRAEGLLVRRTRDGVRNVRLGVGRSARVVCARSP
jgi:hypothetical protein